MIAKVNMYYSTLLVLFGMCVGYYLMPYFFKPDEKTIFEQGVLYGILSYKDYLHRMGSFDIVGDSTIVIKTTNDSLVIYK